MNFQNYERFIAQGEEALVEHNQIAALENFNKPISYNKRRQ